MENTGYFGVPRAKSSPASTWPVKIAASGTSWTLNQYARLTYGRPENVSYAVFRLPASRAWVDANAASDGSADQPISVTSVVLLVPTPSYSRYAWRTSSR